ncbi:MAG: EamA family transporter [Anaerolineae bacterium]
MPSNSSASRWQVIVAFACIYFLWGGSFLAIRYSLETIPTFMISGIRFTCAGLILIGLGWRSGAARPSTSEWRAAALLGFVMFFLANGALVIAEHLIPSGLAATLYATLPFWIALLGWWWQGEARPDRRMIGGLALGFAGVVLMFNPFGQGASLNPTGGLLVLFSAFSWGAGSLLSRRVPKPTSTLLASGMNLFCAGIMFLVVSAIIGEWGQVKLSAVSLKSVLSLVYLIVGSSTLAFSAYMWLMNVTTPNRVATYAYVNPVVALILGAWAGNEVLTTIEIIAAGVIIAAVIILTTARKPSPPLKQVISPTLSTEHVT